LSSRIPNQKIVSILILFLTLTLFAACSDSAGSVVSSPTLTPPPTVEATPSTGRGVGDTLRLLFWQAPTTLNPHLTTNQRDWNASRIVYEPLASYDKDGNLVPFLAAEIPTLENGGLAEDGRSVTWRLREDVLWSDGEPFTADDVLFTYEYVTSEATGAATASTYTAISSVEVVNDYTVRLNFLESNPAWASPFVGVQGLIVPRHIFENYTGSHPCETSNSQTVVGTGPYRLVTCNPEEVLFLGNELVQTIRIIYEPNPYFREEDQPYFSRLELLGGGTVNEAARRVLQVGDIDFAWNLQLDGETLAALELGGKGHVVTNFGSRVERLQINRTDPTQQTSTGERSSLQFPHPFLTDPLVQEALTLAIDREKIAALYGPTGSPTSNILVSPANLASPNTSYVYDRNRAAALLDEAGWVDNDGDGIRDKDGIEMSVVIQTTVTPLRQATQEIIKENLESIGFEVIIKIIDGAAFGNRAPENTNSAYHFYADLQMLFFGNRSPDPDSYMAQWTCSQIPQEENGWAGSNIERWCNPNYDALLSRAAVEIDPEVRAQIFVQMNDMLVNEVVMIPLVHLGIAGGVAKNLLGVDLTPWDVDVWNIKDWRRGTP
jgi:peptide/nickel transport system substrate-binding protein